ncbi:MAG: LysM domain-containing protein [Myxococcota bacterium]|nr:LysM domain-containing protein [Myxococcota bacterium]
MQRIPTGIGIALSLLALVACQEHNRSPEAVPDASTASLQAETLSGELGSADSSEALEQLAEILETPATDTGGVSASLDQPLEGEDVEEHAGSFELQVRHNENLVLIAEWAELPVDLLIDANPELDPREPLYPGQILVVPVADDTPLQQARNAWLERRLANFHTAHGGVAGVSELRVRSGESTWGLSKDLGIPVWVLAAYNPNLDVEALQIGDRLRHPVLMDSVQLAGEEDLGSPESELTDGLFSPAERMELESAGEVTPGQL